MGLFGKLDANHLRDRDKREIGFPNSPHLSPFTPSVPIHPSTRYSVCKGTFHYPMRNWYGLRCPKMDRNTPEITGFSSIFLLRELKYSKNLLKKCAPGNIQFYQEIVPYMSAELGSVEKVEGMSKTASSPLWIVVQIVSQTLCHCPLSQLAPTCPKPPRQMAVWGW